MESVLKQYFGYSQFRPYQKEIIQKVLDGRDCLVVMATGSGKSLCYQIPPLVRRKTAIIISPLLALMQDQVMSLKQRGIQAEYLGSTQMDQTAQSKAEGGKFDILYLTPERACSLTPRFWEKLMNVGICLVAVDEAHCISEWGHSFRKEYKELHMLRDVLSGIPFVALTATATEKVRDDIIHSLNMINPYIAVGSFDRPNLFYGVKSFKRSTSFLDELVTEVSKYDPTSGSTIIYCTTIKDAEQVYLSLKDAGIKSGMYHGQMGSQAREECHRSFIRDELQVMVATIAFGMGIDKPNIRCVIHYGCPKSLESYYQESGRCGRDGLPSVCWLYYSRVDFTKADFYCAEAQSKKQRDAIMESFRAGEKYCLLTTCRRKFLLDYFGEETNNCGNCDNCIGSKRERDLSRESFLLLSCIQSSGNRWGLNMPIDILRGSRAKKIVENNYDKLPLHGLGKHYSSIWWKALAGQLLANGYLKENIQDTYRCVSVSLGGVQFLRNAGAMDQPALVLTLTSEMVDEEECDVSQKRVDGDLQNLAARECDGFSEAEAKLYHMLLDVRKKLARDAGTAPYAICGDQTIKKIAKIRPSSKARLANIDGVNQIADQTAISDGSAHHDLSFILYYPFPMFRENLVTKYGDILLQNISHLSQGENLPLDGESTIQTATTKKVYPNAHKKLPPARSEAWKLWQMEEHSFQEIATVCWRSGPIKEQTVISYILEAAQEGCEINWARFCKEIELTHKIFSQIHCAVTKIGSKDRLKPIKDELPECVSYTHIKTFLVLEELGISAEEIFGKNASVSGKASSVVLGSPSSSDLVTRVEKGTNDGEICTEDRSSPHSPKSSSDAPSITPCDIESLAGTKHKTADSPLNESSSKRLRRDGEPEKECNKALEATESSILEWLQDKNGAPLADIVEHFKGSKRESIVGLLYCLESEFLIFKKNNWYMVM